MSSGRLFQDTLGILYTECSKTSVSKHFGAWSRKLDSKWAPGEHFGKPSGSYTQNAPKRVFRSILESGAGNCSKWAPGEHFGRPSGTSVQNAPKRVFRSILEPGAGNCSKWAPGEYFGSPSGERRRTRHAKGEQTFKEKDTIATKPLRNCRGEAKPSPFTATFWAGSKKSQG